jgi:hypothetical protein
MSWQEVLGLSPFARTIMRAASIREDEASARLGFQTPTSPTLA